jgi:hypothetical protein
VPRSIATHTRSTFTGSDLLDIACVAVTAATAVAVAVGERNAFRSVVVVIFTAYVPGRSIVSNWPSMAARSQVAISVLFSLTILTFAATVTLWLDSWHPLGLLEVECAIATTALFTAILRRRWAALAREATGVQAERLGIE